MRAKARAALAALTSLAGKRDLSVPWNKRESDWVTLRINKRHQQTSINKNYVDRITMRQWCRDHCHQHWSAMGSEFSFESSKDAFTFKLEFGEILE